MKINKLSFKDKAHKWELEETTFDRLTLLVGASAVGKTRILRAIETIKDIALGKTHDGIEWHIDFTTKNSTYIWEGQTDISEDINRKIDILGNNSEINPANILVEKIYKDGKILIDRTRVQTEFNGMITPKLSLSESIISILKEEDSVKPIVAGFNRINISDHSSSGGNVNASLVFNGLLTRKSLEHLPQQNSSMSFDLKVLRDAHINLKLKLHILYLYGENIFNKIKNRYIDIFPQVEDIKLTLRDLSNTEEYVRLSIQIKEKGVDEWIEEKNISSGMYRTLIHISEMYLCADGTVFLIDEFENSLGINCIDQLTEDILGSDRQIQFIITSHHPYIINNIDFSFWKLVTRTGSVVRTSPITNHISGKSSHDKFMQLIQLTQYQTGQDNPA